MDSSWDPRTLAYLLRLGLVMVMSAESSGPKISEPRAATYWVLAIDSLKARNLDDAYRVMATIQTAVEDDPASLVPFLELSAYALMALNPLEDDLLSEVEREFGPFLRDRVGLPCDQGILRAVLRNPAGPIEALPPGVSLNGAMYISLAMLAALAQRDSGPASSAEFAKAALNLRYEVEGEHTAPPPEPSDSAIAWDGEAAAEEARGKVYAILSQEAGASIDQKSRVVIDRGSTRIYINFVPRPEREVVYVTLTSPVARYVPITQALFEHIARRADKRYFGHLAMDPYAPDSEHAGSAYVYVTHTLVGDFLNSDELTIPVFDVLGHAVSICDDFVTEFGGETYHS